MRKTIGTLLALALLAAPAAHAEVTITFQQSGGDVVATGSGTVNTAAFTYISGFSGIAYVGGTATVSYWNCVTMLGSGFATTYGASSGSPGHLCSTGGRYEASSYTGDPLGILGYSTVQGTYLIYVPTGYVSGDPLSATATWTGATFASLGLVPGIYEYHWVNGNETETATLNIGDVASETAVFTASLSFTNGAAGSLSLNMSCNGGLPLSQEYELDAGSEVAFTLTDIPDDAPVIRCEITASDPGNYTLSAVANGGTASDSCVYERDNDTGMFSLFGANTCVFTATPSPTAITVNTTFENYPNDDIASDVDTSFETEITCQNAAVDNGSAFGQLQEMDDTGTFTADWYADPDGGADCTVTLTPLGTGVEGDQCEFSFAVGDEEAGCDVVGTIFFEGIPTLSQYGMVLMALLLLGVGMVGFRRFA